MFTHLQGRGNGEEGRGERDGRLGVSAPAVCDRLLRIHLWGTTCMMPDCYSRDFHVAKAGRQGVPVIKRLL